MNRRFTSLAIAAVLTMGAPAGAVPAMGETKPAALPAATITQAQAEAAVKALVALPQASDAVQLHWDLQESRSKSRTWELHLSVREGNSTIPFPFASVDAATGRVLRYGIHSSLPRAIRTGPVTGVHTEAEAKARAWALVQKIAAQKAPLLKEAPEGAATALERYQSYTPSPASAADNYNFTWFEYHDGVPFPESSVSVGLDKETLDVTTLNVGLLDGVKFQAGPARVTAGEALKLWQDAAKPPITYQQIISSSPFGPPRASGYKLMYTFGNLAKSIDAVTGAWVKDDSPYSPATPEAAPGEPEAVPAGNVTPVVPQALPLSDADARKIAAAVLEVPDTAVVQENVGAIGPSVDDRDMYFAVSDNGAHGSLRLAARTGLIQYASRPVDMEPAPVTTPEGKVTPEQEARAKEAAIALVQRFYSGIRSEMRLVAMPEAWGSGEEQIRRFHFGRYANGIAVPLEGVDVTIDLASMKWRDFNANWSTGSTFPNAAGAVSPDTAHAAAMADRKPLLIYRSVDRNPSNDAPELTEATLSYVLVPQAGVQVDALTGKVTTDGFTQAELEAAYAQIAGHWAEGELRHMLSRRALRPDQIKPDAPLTRVEAAVLLLNRNQRIVVSGPPVPLPYTDVSADDPAYPVVRIAWNEGWLRPLGDDERFRPDRPITRVEYAVWAARALGLGDLARSDLDVNSGYSDLAELTGEQRNAVSFLRALGMVGPADTFRPGDPLTQAEGAALTARIHNYLLKR